MGARHAQDPNPPAAQRPRAISAANEFAIEWSRRWPYERAPRRRRSRYAKRRLGREASLIRASNRTAL